MSTATVHTRQDMAQTVRRGVEHTPFITAMVRQLTLLKRKPNEGSKHDNSTHHQ